MADRFGRGCGRRSSSGPIRSRPTRIVWLEIDGRRRLARAVAGLLDREQGGQQPLARPDPAAGGRGPAPLSLGGASARVGDGLQPVPGHDRPAQPSRPLRVGRDRRARPRGAGRQPDDDGPGRCAGARPTTSTSRPSACTPTSGPPRATCRRAARTSARSSAAWRSAAGSTGSPSGSRWEAFQHYLGATNLLMTELTWRNGPIRVLITDFVVMGDCLPRTAGGTDVARPVHQAVPDQERGDRAAAGPVRRLRPGRGQRRDRRARPELARRRPDAAGDQPRPRPRQPQARARRDRRIRRRARRPRRRPLRADRPQRGDPAPLARPAGGRDGHGRPAGQRRVHRLARRPGHVRALAPPRPGLVPRRRPRPGRADDRRRSGTPSSSRCPTSTSPSRPTPSASAARPWPRRCTPTPHWGAIASGFDRGLSAYCWPREAIWVGGTLDRLGHPTIGRGVFRWLAKVRGQNRPFAYWFQKYTIDGGPEWETPAVDQTAMIPWGLERHYRRTGDLDFVADVWPMIEQAAAVCRGASGHPGLPLDRRPEA